jgi:hypothetical protein
MKLELTDDFIYHGAARVVSLRQEIPEGNVIVKERKTEAGFPG